jgi:hypothetical protein
MFVVFLQQLRLFKPAKTLACERQKLIHLSTSFELQTYSISAQASLKLNQSYRQRIC